MCMPNDMQQPQGYSGKQEIKHRSGYKQRCSQGGPNRYPCYSLVRIYTDPKALLWVGRASMPANI